MECSMSNSMRKRVRALGLSALLALPAAGAYAQDEAGAAQTGALTIELNTLQSTENGCMFTFVAENGIGAAIGRAAYEVVLFNGQGLVSRMTVLDFQDLPQDRMRVRQFNIAETDCDDISRVLINDVSACEGDGVSPGQCMDRLTLASQSDVEFAN
jgi:hypothetical protein